MFLGFIMWQMRIEHDVAAAAYGDLPAVVNFLVSAGMIFCIFAMLSAWFLMAFTSAVPEERFRRDPAFLSATTAHLNHTVVTSLVPQWITMAVLLIEGFHGLKQWYAVALIAIMVALMALQAPQDVALVTEAHALPAIHAPGWFRAMLGIPLSAKLLENARRSRDLLLAVYEKERRKGD